MRGISQPQRPSLKSEGFEHHMVLPSLLDLYQKDAHVCANSLQSCPTLCNPMDCSLPGSPLSMDSPGKNTEVACHALLQGIFPTHGVNPGLLHCRLILYCLSHEASKLGTYFKCRVVTRKSRFLWYGMIITVAISAVACSSEIFEMCLKLFYLFYFSIRKC